MNILVTGGVGFIGSHLVDRLLLLGHNVTVYDAMIHGFVTSWRDAAVAKYPDRFKMIRGDMGAGERLMEALYDQDLVYHLAANADVRGGTKFPGRDLEQNLLATNRLLEHMRQAKVARIAFASTSAVYGNQTVFPTSEDAPFPVQTSLYGASKVAAEGLISAYCYGFGMWATIYRFAPVLGERYAHGHVWDFYQKLKTDPHHIMVLGNGKQAKSYVYVADVIDALVLEVIQQPRMAPPVLIYNVGTDEVCTVDQSLDWICEEMGVQPERQYTGGEGGWPGDPPRIELHCGRLRNLGWKPTVSIRDAVIRTVRSFE